MSVRLSSLGGNKYSFTEMTVLLVLIITEKFITVRRLGIISKWNKKDEKVLKHSISNLCNPIYVMQLVF